MESYFRKRFPADFILNDDFPVTFLLVDLQSTEVELTIHVDRRAAQNLNLGKDVSVDDCIHL